MDKPDDPEVRMSAQPAFNKQFDLIASNLRSNHSNGYVNVVVSGQATQLERLHDVFHDRLEEGEEPVPYKPHTDGTQ